MASVVVLLFLSVYCAFSFACEEGWYKFKNSCYNFVDDKDTWSGAETECQLYDSHLTAIETEKENTFLVEYLQKNDFGSVWIGGSDRMNHDNWVWVPRATKLTFTFWGNGEPSKNWFFRGPKNCLEMTAGFLSLYKWHSRECDSKSRFICEKIYDENLQATHKIVGKVRKTTRKPFEGPDYDYSTLTFK